MRFVPRALLVALIVSTMIAGIASDAFAQGLLIPLSTRHSVVFDHSGHYLYVSTSDGWVRPYNLTSRTLEPGYNLGGSLNGLDISPDDSFLLVAQDDWSTPNGIFHKLDLRTGAVTNITYSRGFGEGGGWDVAIASNEVALVTTAFLGSGSTPLRQIDLRTNTINVRTDAPGSGPAHSVRGKSRVTRNAGGTRLLVSEPWAFQRGPSFIYDARTNNFSLPTHQGGGDHGAINTDGTLLANGFRVSVSLDSATNYELIRVFGRLGAGVAFDPLDDSLYAASLFTNDIVAYEPKTFAEKFRLPVGERVDYAGLSDVNGNLVASPDGKYLALVTTAGVRLFKIRPSPAASGPATFELSDDMVFDHSGKYLYIATFRGYVWPYNLATGKLESPYYLGGIINGIDIAPDDSFLLAAQNFHGVNQGTFQRLDLQNGAITNITYDLPGDRPDDGSWDVAIASNGKAFATTFTGGSANTSLRQIELLTNAITIRGDAPAFGSLGGLGAQIHRSANRNRLVFFDSQGSNGPIFSYDAISDKFGPAVTQNKYWGQTSAAVDRNGSLMAWAFDSVGGHLQTVPSFTEIHSFPALNSGVAFDATRDVVYGVSARLRQQIVGYDTNTFAENFSMDIGELVPSSYGQFDVGNLVASQDGRYLALTTPTTTRVFNIASKTVVALPTPTPPPGPPGRLANISTRAVTGTGDNVPIGGFIIDGTSPKKVIVRALGPTLGFLGVPSALDDPTLELHDQTGALVEANDDWRNSPGSARVLDAGLFPSFERESAIAVTLSPGAYTAVLRGKNQTTGVALIEVYDIDPGADSRLANISTRGLVGTGDNVMIAGVIVNSGSTKVLVRGVGPSLAQFNVPDPLSDPTIEVRDRDGGLMASNDDWQEHEAEVWNSGFPPTNLHESALILTLAPGNYTAILRGKDNATGNGLVEVYSLQ